jgi:hypothetical protein
VGFLDSILGFLSHKRESQRDARAQRARLTARYDPEPYEFWVALTDNMPDPASFVHHVMLANVGQAAATKVTVWLAKLDGTPHSDEVVVGLLRPDEPEREVTLYEEDVSPRTAPGYDGRLVARWEDESGEHEETLLTATLRRPSDEP